MTAASVVLPAVLVAVGAGAAAVALMVPARARLPGGDDRTPGRSRRSWLLAGAALVIVAVQVGGPQAAALVAVCAGAVRATAGLLTQRRRQRVATATAGRVIEVCEQLAAELAAGQPPGACLTRVARTWPPAAPVAEAFRVGADVPEAWRRVAAHPGAGDLRLVGAAWQVAHRTGQGLAEVVDRVALDLRAAGATRRLVEGELASARATARLVAGLPLLALVMGTASGGNPVGFLLTTPVGIGCLAGGVGFALLGLWWIESLARTPGGAR